MVCRTGCPSTRRRLAWSIMGAGQVKVINVSLGVFLSAVVDELNDG